MPSPQVHRAASGMVDESTDPELTFPLAIERHTQATNKEDDVDEKEEGHRAYTAERKANLIRLSEDLRNSDSLLKEFIGNPDEVAAKYGLKLTEEEVSVIAESQGELTDEALAAVAGGGNGNCNCHCNDV